MVTGVGVRQISLAHLNLPTSKTPIWCNVQELGTYLLYKLTYSKFSVKNWQIMTSYEERTRRRHGDF